MSIPILDILQIQYPTATVGVNGQIQLQDHGDGNGPVIGVWNVPSNVTSVSLGVTGQPTAAQLLAWQTDTTTTQTYTYMQNAIANAPILAQLQAIDAKTIRSLRESDPTMLATLTTQAVALRAQLLPTSGG